MLSGAWYPLKAGSDADRSIAAQRWSWFGLLRISASPRRRSTGARDKHADLQRTQPLPSDDCIYPRNFAPVLVVGSSRRRGVEDAGASSA